jgi:hypothetical protein
MTPEQIAGCIAVIKNMLAMGFITRERAVSELMGLADSICDSAHYVPGTSPLIDNLLKEVMGI